MMQLLAEAGPVKMRPGVGLAPRRNIGMPGQVLQFRIGLLQAGGDGGQRIILRIRKGQVIAAFQLNADRIIIAFFQPQIAGAARMPCAVVEVDELQRLVGLPIAPSPTAPSILPEPQ